MAALFARFLVLLAICTWAELALGQGWQTNSWPASNKVSFAGSSVSSTISRASGSTGFTNAAQTEWHFVMSNYPVVFFRGNQPTSGVWNALAEQTNSYVKIWLPPLPAAVLFTSGIASNSCVTNQIYAGATNTVTNVCTAISLSSSNYSYMSSYWTAGTNGFTNTVIVTNHDICADYDLITTNAPVWVITNQVPSAGPTMTNTTVAVVTNWAICGSVTNLCIASNSATRIQIDPCALAKFLTNSVVSTQCFWAGASITRPPNPSVSWANTTNTIWCNQTNTPLLANINYTVLVATQSIVTTVCKEGTYYDPNITNSIIATNDYWCFPATNWNLNVGGTWTFDVAMATGERQDALNIARSWQRFAPDVLPLNAAAVVQNLPQWKGWVTNNAHFFAVKELADSNGLFTGYCSTVQSNWTWITPAADTATQFWTKHPTVAVSNQWTLTPWNGLTWTFSYRTIPTWPPPATNPSPYIPPVGVEQALCEYLGLARGYVSFVVSNWDTTAPGWYAGAPYVHTTNLTAFVTTNRVMYGSYFVFTPDMHHANYDQGLGHIVTNTWWFTGPSDWLTWNTNAPAATNLSIIVTNPLTILGNTFLNLSVPFYSNGWANVSVQASNSVFDTLQIASFTNWQTVATNRYAPGMFMADNCSSNLFTTNVITGGVTNTLTNIVLTCNFTNTASVNLKVFENDFNSQITNMTVPANSNLLLSVTLTNINNSTNAVAVFTNWSVAVGYHEQDYDWEGVRHCLDSFSMIWTNGLLWHDGYLTTSNSAVSNACFTFSTNNVYDLPLFNRYGTNLVSDLITKELLGYFWTHPYIINWVTNYSVAVVTTNTSPPCLTTTYVDIITTNWGGMVNCSDSNTLADALSGYDFTNTWMDTGAVPFATSYATVGNNASCGYFRKDTYTQISYTKQFPIGSTNTITLGTPCHWMYTCGVLNPSYPACGGIPYSCPQYTPVGDQLYWADGSLAMGGNWTYHGPIQPSPCDFVLRGSVAINAFCFECQPATLIANDCSDLNVLTNVFEKAPFPTIFTNDIPPCPNYIKTTVTFWHGTITSDIDECCNDGTNLWKTVVRYVKPTLDVRDNDPTALASTNSLPTVANDLSANYLVQQQSSVGIFTDVCHDFESERDVYVQGVIPTVSYGTRWYQTNSYPVRLDTSSNITVSLVANTNLTACQIQTYQYPDAIYGNSRYTYQSIVQTWPVYVVSNAFVLSLDGSLMDGASTTNVITNALWQTTGQWAGSWQGWGNGAPIYGLLATNLATTNTLTVTNLLRSTPIITQPGTPDDVLRGYGVGSAIIILNFGRTTNGFPHQP